MWQPPNEVTIPRPMSDVHVRGVHAKGRYFSSIVRIRINERQLQVIDDAAELCQVNRATFMRWCSLKAANAIIDASNNR